MKNFLSFEHLVKSVFLILEVAFAVDFPRPYSHRVENTVPIKLEILSVPYVTYLVMRNTINTIVYFTTEHF